MKFFKFGSRVRYIDFNQGVDARLVTDVKNVKNYPKLIFDRFV